LSLWHEARGLSPRAALLAMLAACFAICPLLVWWLLRGA
jgi:hypothetical protein